MCASDSSIACAKGGRSGKSEKVRTGMKYPAESCANMSTAHWSKNVRIDVSFMRILVCDLRLRGNAKERMYPIISRMSTDEGK